MLNKLYKKAKMAFLITTEPSRVAIEALQLRSELPKLLVNAPKGDGHPVLVIPGFMAHDHLTKPLRNFIEKLGYKTYGWENGINAGLTEDKINRLYDHLKKISEENGGQKVTIIGWSLGGIEARCMAHEVPEMIRDVITLGSPFGISEHPDASPKLLVNAIQKLNEEKYTLKAPGMTERMLTPAKGIPTTSIYSEQDGIAGWRACRNPNWPLAQDIKVEDASHAGLVVNPKVYSILADRLAQPEGKWKRYKDQCAEHKRPENPKFEVNEKNTFLPRIPLADRIKPSSRRKKGHIPE